MAANGVYAGDRPPSAVEAELASDPAAGGFFATDFRKHDDLKNMLDSNKDGLKLEAMKRIIGMIAKGKDASELFPSVVKNVVSKNIEVKKLVYVYLVRYAEEQQDLALLSISTFQRALKDPNQLIRASALRVLSSIRVPVIVPIMMLAIKDAVNDMSPYVRKTSAHAIPKLYSLDPEQKDQLIEVIEKLLSDKTTLVVGSAVMAFEEVCPERIDLVHKNYRKLCSLLVDVEEWGQVVIINMLTRYARTQFTDPNQGSVIEEADKNLKLYDSSESEEKEEMTKVYVMDPDHRLLLRNCKPLLQSRNAAVVMGVAQLYYYLAPKNEVNLVAKPLIRLLHSHREIQSVVLSNVATISTKKKGMFEPFLKNFFVRFSDPTHIKLLKLEVLTNLASETNISIILREFQTYVSSSDMEFVAATIQAIGRAACSIKEVTDTCLNGLVTLLSNRNETLVAESVVVIKKLLQMQPSEHKDIIAHMARLVDTITVPMARASILWLLGEYADRVPKIAPDVLRKVAKTFTNEEDIVKLQALNLGAKLYLTNSKQTKLLAQYVFNLAKYDQNYDIRDRARFLRQLIFPQGDKPSLLAKHAKKILLAQKPAPVLQSQFQERDQYQLGSLSHYINSRAQGYHDIPDFPEVAPDPSVRNVEIVVPWQEAQVPKKKRQAVKTKSFYSETESSSSEESGSVGSGEQKTSSEKSGSSESESEESESGMETSESEEDSDEELENKGSNKSSTSEESESSESSDDNSSDEDGNTSDSQKVSSQKKSREMKKPKNNLDLLLDLEDFSVSDKASTIPPPISSTVCLNPTAPTKEISSLSSMISEVSVPALVPTKTCELLNRYSGQGLVATYRFTRSSNIYSPKMTSIALSFTNLGTSEIKGLHIPDKKQGGIEIKGFPEIASLAPEASVTAPLSIDFNESIQTANFEVKTSENTFPLSIKPPVGEILQPVSIGQGDFIKEQSKLKGMNENVATIIRSNLSPLKDLAKSVYEVANVWQLSAQNEENVLRFCAQTLSTRSLVLIAIQLVSSDKLTVTVNCEKMVIGSMLVKDLKEAIAK